MTYDNKSEQVKLWVKNAKRLQNPNITKPRETRFTTKTRVAGKERLKVGTNK